MKLLFCKIPTMKFYQGVTELNQPFHGEEAMTLTEKIQVENNFNIISCVEAGDYCFGYMAPYLAYLESDSLTDVLVIWCAPTHHKNLTIVGWFKHAVVYQTSQTLDFGMVSAQSYNTFAKLSDCVLLPEANCFKLQNKIPLLNFDESPVLEAKEDDVVALLDVINNYNGENWIINSLFEND